MFVLPSCRAVGAFFFQGIFSFAGSGISTSEIYTGSPQSLLLIPLLVWHAFGCFPWTYTIAFFSSCWAWACLVFFLSFSFFSLSIHSIQTNPTETSLGERERKKAAKIQPLVAKISGKESKKATRRDNLDQTRYTTGLAGCPDTTVWLSDRWRALSLTSTVGFARLMLPHTCWHILAIEYYQRLTCKKIYLWNLSM